MDISGTLKTRHRAWLFVAALGCAFVASSANAQSIISSERGLSEPVPPLPDVATLNAQEAATLVARLNQDIQDDCPAGSPQPWVANGTTVTSNETTLYNSGVCDFSTQLLDVSNGEHRVFDTVVGTIIDNTSGSPGQVKLVSVLPDGTPISVVSDDIEGARQELLSTARATGPRFFITSQILTGGGPIQATDRVVSQLLTGRDELLLGLLDQIGGGGSFATIGSRAQCPTAGSFDGCAGGIRWELPAGTSALIVRTMTVLYITNTVERTLTGGTSFYDVTLTPLPNGTAHAAAQTVGLALGDRFLRRLTTPGAAGFGQPLGPKGDAARWRVFLEGAGANGDLTGNDRYYFRALRGGISRMVNQNLDLGLAFEAGNWSYKHPDTFVPERAEGDLWRLGAFARYTPGPWRLHGAVIGGEQDVETTGLSLAGGGTSRSKVRATLYGAGIEAGYAIPVDGFTLTPHARVNALRWSSPATIEIGGLAPLSVRKATREQVRLALGATLGKSYEIEPGLDLGVEIGARAFTTIGDVKSRVVASDAVAPAPFAIDGPATGRSGVELTAGLTLVKDGRMAIAASYEGRFAGDEQSHAGMLTLKMTF